MNRDAVVQAMQQIIQNSPFFPILFPIATQFGLSLGRDGILVNLDFPADNVDFEYVDDVTKATPALWVEVKERDLLRFAEEGVAIPNLKVRTDSAILHPALERLLMRLFTPASAKMPVSDREDLIYASLFGFKDPVGVWQGEEPPVIVLSYPEAVGGLHAFVTSGFSNPELGPPAFTFRETTLSGFGYELVMLAEDLEGPLRDQFVAWARYVCRTKEHIVRGNWLEYEEGLLPGSTIGGYLIVPPTKFPDKFPMGEGRMAWWNLLLPATPQEIAAAKQSGALDVAQRIFEAGFEDFSPLNRPSTV
jgi:hypothetical protein